MNPSRASTTSTASSTVPCKEVPLRPTFHLIVQCTDERDQKELYQRMQAEKRRCRVISL